MNDRQLIREKENFRDGCRCNRSIYYYIGISKYNDNWSYNKKYFVEGLIL